MVYPVSNNPYAQSIPASNTFQPGEARRVAQEQRIPDITQPSGTQTARTEASSTRGNNRVESSRTNQLAYEDTSRARDSGASSSSSSRGTQLDITA